MYEQEAVERLEAKVNALEETLSYQTQLLEAQQERDRQRRIWFWIKLGILLVLAVILIPRGAAFFREMEEFVQQSETQMAQMQQQMDTFLQDTSTKLSTVAEAMESLKNILAPLEDLVAKWRAPW